MAKHRTRRQRKKLRVGEFRELGFSASAELQAPLSDQQRNALVDAFLEQCIEANGMLFGGGSTKRSTDILSLKRIDRP